MKKKIYVVKIGFETGIYDEWKKCEAQVMGFEGALYRGFEYRTEFEKEDEEKEGSLRHALILAEEYMRDINKGGLKLIYQGKNQNYLEEERWKKDGFLPFGKESPDAAVYPQDEVENGGIEAGSDNEVLFEDPQDEDRDLGWGWNCEGVNECLAKEYGKDVKDAVNDYIAQTYSEDINDYLSRLYEYVEEEIKKCIPPAAVIGQDDVNSDVNKYLADLVYTEFRLWKQWETVHAQIRQWKQWEAELREYAAKGTGMAKPAKLTGMEKLEKLVGLAEAKEQLKKIAGLAKMKKDMPKNDDAGGFVALHMEFVGNPGTAKTTVARIVAEIFHEIGLLPSSELIEVGRADLVAGYIGQTAIQVKEVFKKAEGKVLFIDEAYSLVDDRPGSFGDEAINTIIQEMENNRDKTVVILAGYPAEMEQFFSRNPGLRSRVPFTIRFSDYSAEDMVKIAGLEAKKQGFSISPEAYEKVTDICSKTTHRPDPGNGRFCRNLVESAILNYASRHYADNDGNDNGKKNHDWILIAEDFPSAIAGNSRKVVPIGFHVKKAEDLE